ncbi:MAG: nucleotidyltransferase family protein [Planctomycetes bacterium]|nr:nucleotidyltransferase family protein [Planctomycetota bacterium]
MASPVKTKQDTLDALRASGARIKALGVARIGLFGSFVRDEARADSDVDILVAFEPGRKSFDSFMELSALLEEILQRRVELVTVESLSPFIGPHILQEVEYVPLAA